MDAIWLMAERRIKEAETDGAFENLPGKGQPLKLDEDAGVPDDLRMGFKVLKNAGVLPPEMALRQEMVTLQGLIDACRDEADIARHRRKLSRKQLQLNMVLERQGRSLPTAYRGRVYALLSE